MNPPDSGELPAHVREQVDSDVTEILADAGCSGWLHATTIGSPQISHSYDADAPVVLASVYKLAVLISLCRSADRRDIDLAASITVDPTQWAQGPTGLAALRDPVTLSRRDLATSMMTVSDNVAADVLLDEIGLDRVRDDLLDLGLRNTRIVGGVAELHERLQRETGTSTVQRLSPLSQIRTTTRRSALTMPPTRVRRHPRDCTTLLTSVWTDRAASNEMCAFIRDTMRRQVFTSRLASGFPFRRVTVAGKTGTLVAIRNEIGVIEFPGELPVAVAVFTMSARSDPALPHVDRAIGEAARTVVTELRVPEE